ncbi:MAG TPA: Hsp20/alpha crystallin family protein [Usitatibacter sp.]|nr:Hsp20/alpha crystallin family protein [Usitatibacter sp.]
MYASLTRYPGDLFAEFEGLQRSLDQLFGQRGWASSIRAAGRGAFPALNMGTTEQAVEIYAFAPGLDPRSIEVSVDKGLLTLSGERKRDLPQASDKVSIYAEERFAGGFRRAVSLPEDVDPSRVEATYRNGVLKIVIPKREPRKPLRVEIKD